MKTLVKILLSVVAFLALLWAAAVFTGNGYLVKALRLTYLRGYDSASINDAAYFDTRRVPAASQPWEWPLHQQYNQNPLPATLQQTLESTSSVAFLVVKNDSIVNEQYWQGYTDSSRSNSFSMAKSIVTLLAQVAIQKGHFTSWQQPVMEILPNLGGPYAKELQLWHLSTMSSGQLWGEHYKNPWSVTAKAYYGDDLEGLIMGLPIVDRPGQAYNYQSGSTQLLAIALIKATGKPLAQLASEWLWQPLQAKYDATWHLDHADGMELAYCCFNSNARDFARLGGLLVHHGNWNGTQLIDSAFVSLASKGALADYYGYSFWIDPDRNTPVFWLEGILGQYVIAIPEHNLVVVRLGEDCETDETGECSTDLYTIVDEVLRMY